MPATTFSSRPEIRHTSDTMRSEPQTRQSLPLRPAGLRPSNPITMVCDAHHWPTMCSSCKDKTTEIINTGIRKSTYTPRLSTIQPNYTTPVIFDLVIPAKDLDVATEGHILGDAIHTLLHRWIMVGENQCMRLHMWIRRRPDDEDTDLEEESMPNTALDQSDNDEGPALRTRARRSAIAAAAAEARAKEKALNGKLLVSVLIDVPAKRPDFEEMRRNLPRGLTILFPDGDDVIRFEKAWEERPLEGVPDGGVQHPGEYRLDWFFELLSSPAPYFVWSNLPLGAQVSRGKYESRHSSEHSIYKGED
ncbi:uncharacterized protein BDV14DRAFT_195885 [Aspergillus stella-maris]|uniref:uncharacterized protein n=1 Tax=Aspergillus stella-maris TaxID=1810926 RepID=UPI003CCE33A7